MTEPEVYFEALTLSRPMSMTFLLRSRDGKEVGEIGIIHTPDGTATFTINGSSTTYETVVDGRWYRRTESVARASRGAKIMCAKWLREMREGRFPEEQVEPLKVDG
jgi:hypothetical protein